MKKLYNRTALFHARAIVGLFALCLLALPSPALAQAIDLKLTNVTVKEAIEALNQRENYSVAIKSAGVDMQRRVSISAQNASIDEVLAQIFADQDISYTITGKSISVTKAAPKSLAADKNQLKGVVKDNLGLPVPGATIIVDGTNNGTTTMSNGDFSLENVKLPASRSSATSPGRSTSTPTPPSTLPSWRARQPSTRWSWSATASRSA